MVTGTTCLSAGCYFETSFVDFALCINFAICTAVEDLLPVLDNR